MISEHLAEPLLCFARPRFSLASMEGWSVLARSSRPTPLARRNRERLRTLEARGKELGLW